jgi:hypothetical protein
MRMVATVHGALGRVPLHMPPVTPLNAPKGIADHSHWHAQHATHQATRIKLDVCRCQCRCEGRLAAPSLHHSTPVMHDTSSCLSGSLYATQA